MRFLLTLLFSIFLVACGSGGSGGNSPGTGTVTLAITDNAIEDWDQALMTLSSVTLIGQGGQEREMLDPPQTVDLLALRNVSEFLARETLTARTISKIRLGIDSLTLRKVGMMDEITDSVDVPTPSRKIDLVLQGPVEIRPGENVILTIDVDLHNSIKITEQGNGQIRFRPVVIASVGGSGFARLYGRYTDTSDDGSPGSICELQRVSDADGTVEPLDMCVLLDESSTHYFGPDGEPLVPGDPSNSGDLMDGNMISVYGFLSEGGETLKAEVIARGDASPGGGFRTFNGLVTEPFDIGSRQFGLALVESPAVTVELSEGAKVFETKNGIVADEVIDTDDELTDVIVANKRVEARGALDDSAEPDLLQSFIAFAAAPTATVSGDIENITGPDAEQDRITLTDTDCVIASWSTRIFNLEVGADDVIQLTEIDFDELATGDTIDASGERSESGTCVLADTIVRDEPSTL